MNEEQWQKSPDWRAGGRQQLCGPLQKDLLKKYKAHINIEACATVKSVKYLFKYVYKGHDCANMEMAMEELIFISLILGGLIRPWLY